jgi:hypothetical protein
VGDGATVLVAGEAKVLLRPMTRSRGMPYLFWLMAEVTRGDVVREAVASRPLRPMSCRRPVHVADRAKVIVKAREARLDIDTTGTPSCLTSARLSVPCASSSARFCYCPWNCGRPGSRGPRTVSCLLAPARLE